MTSRADMRLDNLANDIPLAAEDIAALRELRIQSRKLTPEQYQAFLNAMPRPSVEKLRARKVPTGPPFEL